MFVAAVVGDGYGSPRVRGLRGGGGGGGGKRKSGGGGGQPPPQKKKENGKQISLIFFFWAAPPPPPCPSPTLPFPPLRHQTPQFLFGPNLPAPISATYVRACYSPLVYNAYTCFCRYTCTFTVYVFATHKVLWCFMHCPLKLSF